METIKGPFIFLRGRGAGGIWGGGGHRKKRALKGGHLEKLGKRGGHLKYFSCALRWDTFYYS